MLTFDHLALISVVVGLNPAHYALFTLQVVHPVVRSFTWQLNYLLGHPHFVRVVHTTGGVICGYRHLVRRPCPLATVQDLYATLCHSGETSNTSMHLMSLYYTERQPSHNLMYTMYHTFGYRSKKFICTCTESSTYAHRMKSEMEILNIGHPR